jgi:hypothetical protein
VETFALRAISRISIGFGRKGLSRLVCLSIAVLLLQGLYPSTGNVSISSKFQQAQAAVKDLRHAHHPLQGQNYRLAMRSTQVVFSSSGTTNAPRSDFKGDAGR